MATPQEMIALLDLVDEISPQAPRVPEAALERALRRAAKEIFEQALIWRYEADPIPVAQGVHTYAVPVQAGGMAWRVPFATYQAPGSTAVGRKPLWPRTEQQLQGRYSGGVDYRHQFSWFSSPSDWKTAKGAPRFFLHMENPDRVRVVPAPTSTEDGGSLFLDVALTMPRDGTTIPRWIADRYYVALEEGALAHLFGMTDEPWTDQRKALQYAERFCRRSNDAAAHQSASHTTAAQEVSPPRSLDA